MALAKATKSTIVSVDCCEHIIEAIEAASDSRVISVSSRDILDKSITDNEYTLIVIGASDSPLRRIFLSRLKRLSPETPMLFLRRETIDFATSRETLRGEFLLSDKRTSHDLKLVREIRSILPLEPCPHHAAEDQTDLVQDVTRVLSENYSDAGLDLRQVAGKLSVSPTRLSWILNRQVNISFRQMLRQIRIEKAKRLLATHRLSVKEVARRVGFSDSHYFSRTFKELTGSNPTQYKDNPQNLILNP